MLTLSGNPVLSTPDGAALDRALAGLDFMASVDIYINETTRHADVILPPTSALERDHYDLVFQNFAVRNTARFTPAVFDKSRDQRHDWEIYRELATADQLAAEAKGTAEEAARQPGPALGEPHVPGRAAAAHRQVRREHLRPAPYARPGSTSARCSPASSPSGCSPGTSGSTPPRSWSSKTWPGSSAQELPSGDDLLLIGRRHKSDNNSWMHNSTRLTRGRDRHQLLMHPDDLAARGIEDGKPVRVTSRVGSVEVEVLATDDMMRGVVSLPHGYGHQVGGTRMSQAAKVTGVSINDLTDAELLDVSGNAALSGVPVTVASA